MLGPGFAVGLWAALCLVAASLRQRGRDLARGHLRRRSAAIAILLAAKSFWLRRESASRWVRATGPQGRHAGLWPLALRIRTLCGRDRKPELVADRNCGDLLADASWRWRRSAHAAKPGAWQDYAIMLAVALPVAARLAAPTFPYPEFRLGYILPASAAGSRRGLAAFLFVRRLDGIGYSIGWRSDWGIGSGIVLRGPSR